MKDAHKIFLISVIYFIPKWFLSFYFFDEDIVNRIIFEIDGDGSYYLPIVKYLSELNFVNSYDQQILELRIIPIPFGSIFVHSLIYTFIENYSIIITEFLAIFVFLFLFSKIVNFFLSKQHSIAIAALFLIIPLFISILPTNELPFIKILETNFFNLRIHRPMMTTLLLLLFLFLMMTISKKGINSKNSFFLGATLSLSLSGFYYYFIIQALIIFYYITSLCKFNYLQFFKENKKNILIFATTFFVLSIPFFINIYFHENDFTNRMGITILNQEKKFILLEYFIDNIVNTGLIFLVLLSIIIIIIIKNKNLEVYRYLNFFLLLFISSIISPFIFIIGSNKTGLIYHYNNIIVMMGLIFFIMSFICLIKLFMENFFYKYLNKIIYLFCFLVITFFFSNKFYKLNNNEDYRDKRIEFQKVTKMISQNSKNINEISLLTYDNHLMIWGILKDIKNLNVIGAAFSSKTNEMIEDDLIDSFKFFKLNEKNFVDFFENKKGTWRYHNINVRDFFMMRYQANKLNTYNNSQNFDPKILSFINKSSPALAQQIIIPYDEIQRLKEKFMMRKNIDFIAPDIIVLPKNHFIFSKISAAPDSYCTIHSGKFYIYYSNLKNDCN